MPTFGTTVVIPSGLQGQIYNIRRYTSKLPDFSKMKPIGTIYASSLNIAPQDFQRGFPGVTKRYEWFAIDYSGRFWIENPGSFTFSLLSDDGSRLYVDDQVVIENDGQHPPLEKSATVDLAGGIHHARISYFQGPKFQVALVLKIGGSGENLRVFNTDEFKPPPNPETWKFPQKDR